jgi:tellurite resistance protein TehA-like permease
VLLHTIDEAVSNLFPGYFALVMATGIVSIATYFLGMTEIAVFLLVLNILAYVILWILTIARLVRYFPRFLEDLTSHIRGAGFFTLVAGTCVLGSQLVVVTNLPTVALALWWLGLLLWVLFTYTFFTAITVREEKPTLERGINGAWLIAIVATQSVSVLGTLLAGVHETARPVLLFFTLCMYLIGCMLYLFVITLIFYRFSFFRLTMAALTPPYWINMGAVAITTLAGAGLILQADQWFLLTDLLPFLKGFTLFFWAVATWWIPLLFILGAWRHLYKGYPFTYDPQYWGMVFPLGMYTACTYRLSLALDVPFLEIIPRYFIYVALAAWLVTFFGLLHQLVLGLFSGPSVTRS